MRSLLTVATIAVLTAGCVERRSPVGPIALDTAGASFPTTAAYGERVYWSWYGKNDRGDNVIRVSSLDGPTGSPSQAVEIDVGPHRVHVHPQAPPQIAVAPNGDVHVAWSSSFYVEGRRFPASDVFVSSSRDGGRTFESPVAVNDDFGRKAAGHTFHDVAVGPDGTVFVAWLDSRSSGDPSSGSDTGSQHAHGHKGQSGTESQHPHGGPSDTTVRVARSTDGGGTFSPSVTAAAGTCQCCRTALHVAGNGDLFVAWRHIFGSGERDIAAARSDDGGLTFSAPVRVHADRWAINGCPHNGPSITQDDAGRVHVAWYTAADGKVGLYRAVSSDGLRSFERPQPLQTDLPTAHVRLASDKGSVWIVRENPESGRIEVTAGDRMVASFPGTAPSLAVTSGVASVVWQENGNVFGYAYYGAE